MLKVGQVVIPHFAHHSASSCTEAFSEGESPDHLAGKQQLYEFFHAAHFKVQMEAVLSSIAQRPDLFVNDRFAIEFQCSPISKELFDSRNSGYHKAGITPIWILRTPPAVQKLTDGLHVVSLSKFHQLFIPRRPMIGQTLLTYDSSSKTFYYVSHLLHVHQNQFIAKVRRLPIATQQFPFYSVKPPTERELRYYEKVYTNKRQQFIASRILRSRKGINDRFLRYCYFFRIHPEQLPNWIGVPTSGCEIFKGHAAEWQASLVFHMLTYGEGEGSLTVFIDQQPNYDFQLAKDAVNSYLLYLEQIGIAPTDRENLKKSVPDEILFAPVFPHILAKRYEN